MPRKKKMPAKRRTKTRVKTPASVRAQISVSAGDKLAGRWFAKLVALQARLRSPKGCPWDREQTHQSLRKFLIEETYEVLDAMDSRDPRKFSSELGDLLLQVVFHANIAEASGRFTISDVIESVHEKMIRRHPHVFGDVKASTPAAVLKNWEHIKAEERATERSAKGQANASSNEKSPASESILSGVPHSLPGALEAYQLTRRASRVGFDWENLAGIFEKLDEERREIESTLPSTPGKSALDLEEEVGDLLFASVNVARFLGVDPEIALKGANRKFKKRFQWMESAAAQEGSRFADLPRARMEQLWDQSKLQA
jgi:tetrapyrrole methylase family protein/MazG family protein